ncbi:hypothetical protein B0J17DRAFT_721050 [Rhizoctonia solani]|nr:hypothetical protein B0J17DRAFT_721050 [Rhizoctonia solani]
MSLHFAPVLTPENMSRSSQTSALSSRSSTLHSLTSNGQQLPSLAGPNEALRGDFMGVRDEIDESNGKGLVDLDSAGYEEEDVLSGDDLALWPSDDRVHSPSNNSPAVTEQATARAAYLLKRLVKRAAIIDAALQQITSEDLANSPHRLIFEQYANEMQALVIRIRGLLYGPDPLSTSSQNNN